jgi:hypothetical protein
VADGTSLLPILAACKNTFLAFRARRKLNNGCRALGAEEFARTTPYKQFAMIVAHELSHVVLDAIDHPLRKEEKAVDLTAMLLGFSYLYRTGAYTVKHVSYNRFQRRSLGYLSEREIDAASKMLVPWRMRVLHSLLSFANRNAPRLIILGAIAAFYIAAIVLAIWDKH